MWRFKHLVHSRPRTGYFLWLVGSAIFYLSMYFLCALGSWAIVHWYPTAHLRFEQILIVSLFIGLIITSRVHRPFRAAKNREMLTLRLNDEGLRVDGPAGEESFISWPTVRSATESRCLKAVAIWTPNAPTPYLITSISNTFEDYQSSVRSDPPFPWGSDGIPHFFESIFNNERSRRSRGAYRSPALVAANVSD